MFEFLRKRKIWLVYIPLAVYWLVLLTATSIPANSLPSIGLADKINHLLAYFILAILLNLTLLFQKKSRLLFNKASLATLIICIIYGAFDEVHQIFIPGRYAEFLDWLADFAGVILGIFLVYFLKEKSKYQIEFN